MGKDIIDLKPEKGDEGEIVYTTTKRTFASQTHWDVSVNRLFRIALFFGLILLLLIFFVSVVLPILLLIAVFLILRNVIRSLK